MVVIYGSPLKPCDFIPQPPPPLYVNACPTAFHIVALVIAATYNTTLVVKSALGSYLGTTDYYSEWSEANENLDAVYR